MKFRLIAISLLTCTFCLLLAACQGPMIVPETETPPAATWTPTAPPTATLTPSPTATPTATPIPTLIVGEDWEKVMVDPFDDDRYKWTQTKNGPFVVDKSTWQINIVDSVYRLYGVSNKPDGAAWYPFLPVIPAVQDFYYAVDLRIVKSSPDAVAALMFRVTDRNKVDSYYRLETKEPDWFRVRKVIPDPWVAGPTLVEWQETPLITKGQTNRFAVLGIGSKYRFYINGQCVAQAADNDNPYTSGIVGVFARLEKAGDEINVEFDNAEVRVPSDFGNVECP